MIDINFLRYQKQALTKQAKKDKQIFKISVGITIATVLLSLGLIGLTFFLNNHTGKITQKISLTTEEIEKYKETEASYIFLINKLKIIRELFELRADKQAAIHFFDNLFPADVEISGIRYEIEEGILSLKITSPHIFRLEEVFTILKEPNIKKHFLTMNRSNLKREQNAKYSFQLVLSLDKNSDLISYD